MKTFYFSEKDNIYKIFQLFDGLKWRKYKEILLDIDPKNEFFSNKWWLKLVLEKAQDVGVRPVFVITNSKQELLMKQMWVNYVWKKEPLYKKIRNYFFDFLDLLRWNKLWQKYSKFFKLLIIFGEISLVVWLVWFVYNLVTPKTDIYIQPAVKVKHIIQKIYLYPYGSKNVEFDNNLRLAFYTWSFTQIETVKIPVADISFITKPSHGEVKIINTTFVGYSLKPHTQLVTTGWIVYRLDNWVYVPPAKSKDKPWVAYVKVTADEKDVHNQLVWVRWNITEWTKLYIRKMYVSIWKKKIWAQAVEDFKWGETNPTWTVQLKDIQNVKKLLRNKFESNLRKYITSYVLKSNPGSFPLIFSGMYEAKNFSYYIMAKPWDKLPYIQWSLQADITFSYLKKSDIKRIFKNYLEQHIVSMNDFIWWNDSSLQILDMKRIYPNLYLSTISLDAILWYDFDKDYNWIRQQILEEVPGMPIDKAKQFILSFPVIAWVEIKTTDSLDRVSKLKSRIYIHIVK